MNQISLKEKHSENRRLGEMSMVGTALSVVLYLLITNAR